MSNPLVSVIMPCFNEGKYLQEAVNSIICQTYKNWELIIVDDGSDDVVTKKILQSFQDNRIFIFYNKHQGVVQARNTGILHANGKYIVPVDSDDIAEPSLIEKYVNIAEVTPNIGIVYGIYEYFDMRTGIYKLPPFSIENMLISNCINNTSLFLREDWEKVGGYNSNMELGCEDYDFWLSILELGRDVKFLPEVVLKYRVKKGKGRTNEIDIVKEKIISQHIFQNHMSLYKQYFEEYTLAQRNKQIELQAQIEELYREKYKWRMKIYKLPLIYHLLHK